MTRDWRDYLPTTGAKERGRYHGFLSTTTEWHALSQGLYLGFTTKPQITPPEPDTTDVRLESNYYRGAYILGSLLQLVVIAGLAALGYHAAGGGVPV